MRHATAWWTRSIFAWLVLSVAAAASQDLSPDDAKRITGRVVDESGKPIAGAAVGLFTSRDFVDTARLLAEPPAVTDADGSYAITSGAAFAYGVLVLAAAGRQSCALQVVEDLAKDGGSLGETVLVPGGRIVGRVRDEAGAPIPGARVRVESSIVNHFSYRVRLLAGAVSDERGSFVVPCVPRSGLRVTVAADGYLSESRLVAQQSSNFTQSPCRRCRGARRRASAAPCCRSGRSPTPRAPTASRVCGRASTAFRPTPRAGRLRRSPS